MMVLSRCLARVEMASSRHTGRPRGAKLIIADAAELMIADAAELIGANLRIPVQHMLVYRDFEARMTAAASAFRHSGYLGRLTAARLRRQGSAT
jgi:hypothetical protein